MPPVLALAFLLVLTGLATGQTLYKSIGPDGKVVYSDRPPAAGKVEKTFAVQDLPNTAIPEKALAELAALRKTAKPATVRTTGVVLFSATWCGYCRQAKAFLAQRGVRYEEKDIDTPAGKLAFVQAGGAGGVPMLVANGTVVQGFSPSTYEALFPRVR
jgi:glutaredoxin